MIHAQRPSRGGGSGAALAKVNPQVSASNYYSVFSARIVKIFDCSAFFSSACCADQSAAPINSRASNLKSSLGLMMALSTSNSENSLTAPIVQNDLTISSSSSSVWISACFGGTTWVLEKFKYACSLAANRKFSFGLYVTRLLPIVSRARGQAISTISSSLLTTYITVGSKGTDTIQPIRSITIEDEERLETSALTCDGRTSTKANSTRFSFRLRYNSY